MVPSSATRLTELLSPYAPSEVIHRVLNLIDEHEDQLIGCDEHYNGPSADHEDTLRVRNKLRNQQRHHKMRSEMRV